MDTNLVAVIVAAVKATAPSGDTTGALTVILIAMIAAMPPTLVALAGLFKAKEVAAGVKEVVTGVKEVHLSINSRLDKWLMAEHTQGVATGRQQVIVETASAAAAAAVLAAAGGQAAAPPIALIAPSLAPMLPEIQVAQIIDQLLRALDRRKQDNDLPPMQS
jgi:hypothetical protein